MADIDPTIVDGDSGSFKVVKWEGFVMDSGNLNQVGSAWSGVSYGDRSVQVVGTLSSGGEITIEGSNDGVSWFTLKDVFNVALVLTTKEVKAIMPCPLYIRPKNTATSSPDSDVDVIMVARRSNPSRT